MDSEKLVEEIRKFPVLYDQSDHKYRNAEYKERVWKIISEIMKPPGGPEECKKRWASIRDQFRRTLQKRKAKTGQASAKKQKYKYEDILEFLLPHMVERENLSNVPAMEDQRDDSVFSEILDETNYESELESQNPVSQCLYTTSWTTVDPPSPVPPVEEATLNVKRRESYQQKPALESTSSQLMAFILAELEAEKNKINEDKPQQHPVDIFLAGLAPILKSLDPVLLNQAKTAIFTTVQESELKQITKNESIQQLIRNHNKMP